MNFLKILLPFLILFLSCREDKSRSSEQDQSLSGNQVEITDRESFKYIELQKSNSTELTFDAPFVFDPEATNLYNDIYYFAVDDLNRVFVPFNATIKVFDEQGVQVAALGREGRGPGEFDNISALQPKISGKRLFVYVDLLKRINIYDIENLSFEQSLPLESSYEMNTGNGTKTLIYHDFHTLNDSLLLVELIDNSLEADSSYFFEMSLDGNIKESLIYRITYDNFYSGSGVSGPFLIVSKGDRDNPTTRNFIFDMHENGMMVSTDNTKPTITVRDYQNQGITEYHYSIESAPVNEALVRENIHSNDRIKSDFRKQNLPDTYPPFNSIIMDDKSNFWVETIINDESEFLWWVIEKDGSPKGYFYWEGIRSMRHKEGRQIKMIKNGYMYTIEPKGPSGLKRLVRYKFDKF